MVDNTGDRKLSVPSKTLSLKPRVETGTVKYQKGRGDRVYVHVVPTGEKPAAAEAKA